MNKEILIATPISHLFDSLADADDIMNVSDCLEVRQRSLSSNAPKQYLFHVDIDVTHYWSSKTKKYLENSLLLKNELQLVTFQATRCCHGEKIKDGYFVLDGYVYTRNEMLNHASDNIAWLRSVLNSDIMIGLENNNYYPTPAYNIITESNFINSIIIGNNIRFLLDIAHAKVTAHNMKLDYSKYLHSLPLDKLIQLHICAPNMQEETGVAYDAHNRPDRSMINEVISLVLEFSSIKFLTIEYYKDKDVLISSIIDLKKSLLMSSND